VLTEKLPPTLRRNLVLLSSKSSSLEDSTILRNVGNYCPSDSVASQKTWIFSKAALNASHLAHPSFYVCVSLCLLISKAMWPLR